MTPLRMLLDSPEWCALAALVALLAGACLVRGVRVVAGWRRQ